MKKIFTTLAVCTLAISAVHSQARNSDLEIKPYFPKLNTDYPNLNNGDTFYVGAIIKNNGPDAVLPTDTIVFMRQGYLKGGTTGNNYYLTNKLNLNLPSGAQDTVVYYAIQGTVLGTGNGGEQVSVKWKTNGVDSLSLAIWGYTAAKVDFTDAGTTDTSFLPNSNNVLKYTVKFGTVSIADVLQGLAKDNIVIYPNPTSKDLNFKYNFAKAGEATLRILDVTGRVVMTRDLGKQNMGEQTINLNVSTLSNGLYSVEMVSGDRRAVGKFTVSK